MFFTFMSMSSRFLYQSLYLKIYPYTRGVKAVTVVAVEEYGQQDPEPIRMVIKRKGKASVA